MPTPARFDQGEQMSESEIWATGRYLLLLCSFSVKGHRGVAPSRRSQSDASGPSFRKSGPSLTKRTIHGRRSCIVRPYVRAFQPYYKLDFESHDFISGSNIPLLVHTLLFPLAPDYTVIGYIEKFSGPGFEVLTLCPFKSKTTFLGNSA